MRPGDLRGWFTRRRVVTIVALAVAFAGLYVYMLVAAVRAELASATTQAQILQSSILDGRKERAQQALDSLQDASSGAAGTTSNPAWWVAGRVPVLGRNFTAAHTAAQAMDDITHEALPQLVDTTAGLDLSRYVPQDGKVDVAAITRLAAPVSSSSVVFDRNARRLDRIDADGLLPALREPMTELQSKVRLAADATANVRQASELLPSMIGGEKRTYLVVLQNNAEVRATGGLPGATLVVRAEKGRLTLERQGSGGQYGRLARTPIAQTAEETSLWGDKLSRFFVDTNLTPDFPRTAQFARAIVREVDGYDVDGVVSIDPVAVSYLLKGAGSVRLEDGRVIDDANAVDELLNGTYLRYPEPEAQDAFFADTARRLFRVFASGRGDTREVVQGLVRAGREHRLLVWSRHEGEQASILDSPLSGDVAPDSGDRPEVGVYLTDSTGSKLSYYLRTRTKVVPTRCSSAGAQTIRTAIDLESDAPNDADRLPKAVLGDGYGVPAGSQQVNVRLFLPVGSRVESVRLGGHRLSTETAEYEHHPVVTVPVRLEPDQNARLVLNLVTRQGQTGDPRVRVTPGATPGYPVEVLGSRCGSDQ